MPAPPLRFDQRAQDIASGATQRLLDEIPELRGVALVFDWAGGLNAVGPVGMVTDRDALEGATTSLTLLSSLGIMSQLSKLLAENTHRIVQLQQALEETVQSRTRAAAGPADTPTESQPTEATTPDE